MKGPIWRKAKDGTKMWQAKGSKAKDDDKPELPSLKELKRRIAKDTDPK